MCVYLLAYSSKRAILNLLSRAPDARFRGGRACYRSWLIPARVVWQGALREADHHAERLVRSQDERIRAVRFGPQAFGLQEVARPAEVLGLEDQGMDTVAVLLQVAALWAGR